jgi:hypothetical protein
MSSWSREALDRIGTAEELELAPSRSDGSIHPHVTIWVVRVGEELYVRSYRGPNGSWFRRALRSGAGRIRAGGAEHEVTFERVGDEDRAAFDEAYRRKYSRHGAAYVDAMVSSVATATTLQLLPDHRRQHA